MTPDTDAERRIQKALALCDSGLSRRTVASSQLAGLIRKALTADPIPAAGPVTHEVVNMRTGRVGCCGRRLHELPLTDQQACGGLPVTCAGSVESTSRG